MMDEVFVRNRITELRLEADISEHQLSLELGRSKSYIEIENPGLMHNIITNLKQLSNDDLEFFNYALEKYINKS